MYVDRLLPTYTALCVLSLFLDFVYKVGGVALRPFDAMVAAGLFLLIAAACIRGKIRPLRKVSVFYIFVALYLYRFANGIFLSGTGVAVKELMQAIEFVVLIYMVGRATSTIESRKKFLKRLFWGFGIIASFTATWHISQGYIVNYKAFNAPKLSFSLFALFAVPAYLQRRDSVRTAILGLAILLTLLSGERKGWLALAAAGVIVFFAMHGMSLRSVLTAFFQPKYIALVGVFIVAVAVVASQFEYVSQQFQSIRDVFLMLSNVDLDQATARFETSGSNLARLYLLMFTIRMLIEHPFFGIGTARFKEVLEQVAAQEDGYVLGAHSEYQLLAAENGFIGLMLYSVIWYRAIRRTMRLVQVSPVDQYYIRIAILSFIVYGTIINLFLGGGALNIVFMAVSIGLLIGLRNDRSDTVVRSFAASAA